MNKIPLMDGMNLHLIKSKKFKTTTIAILLRRKLSQNESTINALIPRILKCGCEKYPNLSLINRRTEELYGAIFDCTIIKKGEEQIIQFIIEVIKKDNLTKLALDFLSEIMLRPITESGGFKNSSTIGEIENLRKVITGRINNKKEYAKLRCLEEACKNEPFGVYGDGYINDLDNCDAKNTYMHYMQILENSPIEFVIVGDEDENELAEHIRQAFAMKRGEIISLERPALNYFPQKNKTVIENMDVAQSKICLALRSGISQTNKEFYDLMLGNELFGGSANSKLFNRVREKESLCYYINSFVYKFKTILLVQCGADMEKYEKVVSLVSEEISCIANGDFSDEEFNNAKVSIIKKYDTIQDYPAAVLDFYVSQYMLGDASTIADVKRRLEKVTLADTAEVFKKIYIDTVYVLGRIPNEKH